MAFKLNPYTLMELAKGVDLVGQRMATRPADWGSSMDMLQAVQDSLQLRETLAANQRRKQQQDMAFLLNLKKGIAKEKLEEQLRQRDADTLAALQARLAPPKPAVNEASRVVPAYDMTMPDGQGGPLKLRFAFNQANPAVRHREVEPAKPAGDLHGTPVEPLIRLRMGEGDAKGAIRDLAQYESDEIKANREQEKWETRKKTEFEDWLEREGLRREWGMADFAQRQGIMDKYARGRAALGLENTLTARNTPQSRIHVDAQGNVLQLGGHAADTGVPALPDLPGAPAGGWGPGVTPLGKVAAKKPQADTKAGRRANLDKQRLAKVEKRIAEVKGILAGAKMKPGPDVVKFGTGEKSPGPPVFTFTGRNANAYQKRLNSLKDRDMPPDQLPLWGDDLFPNPVSLRQLQAEAQRLREALYLAGHDTPVAGASGKKPKPAKAPAKGPKRSVKAKPTGNKKVDAFGRTVGVLDG